jgi:predicted nucleic acid-binding protein
MLGNGERAAITFALERTDTLLLIDEGKGCRAARRRDIRTVATLGVLDAAAAQDLFDLPVVIQRLQQTI